MQMKAFRKLPAAVTLVRNSGRRTDTCQLDDPYLASSPREELVNFSICCVRTVRKDSVAGLKRAGHATAGSACFA